jgi:hypothetical protein
MALADKKYEGFYTTSGSDADNIDSHKLAHIKDLWDKDVASGRNVVMLEDPHIGPLLYQLQQMQDELDEIRRHIVNDVVGQVGATGPAGPAQTDPTQLDGTQLPTSNRSLNTGDLWNDRGTVKVT